MVKKFILFVLLIVYGVASFGVSLNYFYCCGKLKTVSLSIYTHQQTGNCPLTMGKKGCCKNKTVNHKISVDQTTQLLTWYESRQLTTAILPKPPYWEMGDIFYRTITVQTYGKPPPLLLNHSIEFLNVFRI